MREGVGCLREGTAARARAPSDSCTLRSTAHLVAVRVLVGIPAQPTALWAEGRLSALWTGGARGRGLHSFGHEAGEPGGWWSAGRGEPALRTPWGQRGAVRDHGTDVASRQPGRSGESAHRPLSAPRTPPQPKLLRGLPDEGNSGVSAAGVQSKAKVRPGRTTFEISVSPLPGGSERTPSKHLAAFASLPRTRRGSAHPAPAPRQSTRPGLCPVGGTVWGDFHSFLLLAAVSVLHFVPTSRAAFAGSVRSPPHRAGQTGGTVAGRGPPGGSCSEGGEAPSVRTELRGARRPRDQPAPPRAARLRDPAGGREVRSLRAAVRACPRRREPLEASVWAGGYSATKVEQGSWRRGPPLRELRVPARSSKQ